MARRRRSKADGVIDIDCSQAEDMLEGVVERLKDMKPVNKQIVEVIAAKQAERFHNNNWAPLAESTKKRKESQGKSTEVFRDETSGGKQPREADGLYHVITTPNHPGQIKRASKKKATFGIKTTGQYYYAPMAQNAGGKKGKKGITKRWLLGMEKTDVLIFAKMVTGFILGKKV